MDLEKGLKPWRLGQSLRKRSPAKILEVSVSVPACWEEGLLVESPELAKKASFCS